MEDCRILDVRDPCIYIKCVTEKFPVTQKLLFEARTKVGCSIFCARQLQRKQFHSSSWSQVDIPSKLIEILPADIPI
ncbi:hypothetical protein Y1Q_0022056 [Alligator mississippiensis]|uniref:Uncharacterized protein n=1 Tax=Alligator mississippiensis TaxID=8496 RepID=A0A151NLU8_ALLMI|nr:hypothetical protein Y1Q_0022056 [Alligator mississippiensis]